MVSNCDSNSDRELYGDELEKFVSLGAYFTKILRAACSYIIVMSNFFEQKCYLKLFRTYQLCFYFFGQRTLAEKRKMLMKLTLCVYFIIWAPLYAKLLFAAFLNFRFVYFWGCKRKLVETMLVKCWWIWLQISMENVELWYVIVSTTTAETMMRSEFQNLFAAVKYSGTPL